MIRVRNLTKTFKSFTAVKGISFDVEQGEIFAFLGPNGAGKTTTIKMLTTMLTPSSGTIELDGINTVRHQMAARRKFGIVFQDPSLDDQQTAYENMELHGILYGMPRKLRAGRIEELLTIFELWDRRKDFVKQFSGGMKRRLEIARGLLHMPKIFFLDEPTLGLDPQSRSQLWTHVKYLNETENTTIFLTTHYMDEAEYCDRIAIIDHGEIIVLDEPDTLKRNVGTDRIQIETDDDEAMIRALAEHFGIEATVAEGKVTFGVPAGEQFVPRLFTELGQRIRSVSIARPSLDDVFMSYTGTTIRDAESGELDTRRKLARMMNR